MEAESLALQIRRGLRRKTLRRGSAWVVIAVGLSTLSPRFALDFYFFDLFFFLQLVLVLVCIAVNVHSAPEKSAPVKEAARSLTAKLAEADGRLRCIGAHNPYRSSPMQWVGDDPTASKRPWTDLTTIRATAAALRTRALSAAKDH